MTPTAITLTPDVLSRFHNFDDALIRGVSLSWDSMGDRKASIVIEACDATSDGDERWFKVILDVTGVDSFRFVENVREFHSVLSSGLRIGEFEGMTYFNFGSDIDEPDRLEEFLSGFYVAGRNYRWTVETYPESW